MPICFFFKAPATTEIYTLSLHDALPTCRPTWSAGSPSGSEAHQARFAPGDFQVAAAPVPVGQHPALAAPRVDLHGVAARPMGVPMHQAADAVAPQRLAHGVAI